MEVNKVWFLPQHFQSSCPTSRVGVLPLADSVGLGGAGRVEKAGPLLWGQLALLPAGGLGWVAFWSPPAQPRLGLYEPTSTSPALLLVTSA